MAVLATTMHAALNSTDTPEVHVFGNSSKPETVGSNMSHVVLIVAYSSVVVISVAGNGIVMLSVVTCRRMRTVTNYLFILNLAGADLMMAVFCVPFTFIANWLVDRWPFGVAMCSVMPYLQTVVVFLSAFTLVGLSVDRFRAVVFPLQPRLTPGQVLTIIAVIWLLAIFIPLPVVIFSTVDADSGLCIEKWPNDTSQFVYTASLMALQYFIPLAFLIVCYTTICYFVWIKKTPRQAENAKERRLALSKRKV